MADPKRRKRRRVSGPEPSPDPVPTAVPAPAPRDQRLEDLLAPAPSLQVRLPLRSEPAARRRWLKREIARFLHTAATDRFFLLTVVTGGKRTFYKIARRAFRAAGSFFGDTQLDFMWAQLTAMAGPTPVADFDALQRSRLVHLKMEKLQGLARFITDEAHLDRVLDQHVADTTERAAIRQLMLPLITPPAAVH